MNLAPAIPKLEHGVFKTILLEDWFKIHEEAEGLYKEAMLAKEQGLVLEHAHLIRRYDAYIASADLMLSTAIKYPIAEA